MPKEVFANKKVHALQQQKVTHRHSTPIQDLGQALKQILLRYRLNDITTGGVSGILWLRILKEMENQNGTRAIDLRLLKHLERLNLIKYNRPARLFLS